MQIVKQQSGTERGAWLAVAGQWVKVEIDADRFSGSLNATVIVTLEMIDLRHFSLHLARDRLLKNPLCSSSRTACMSI